MKKLFLLFKLLAIGGLMFILLVPMTMIQHLIFERSARWREAASSIRQGWSQAQKVEGPFLVVPFRELYKECVSKRRYKEKDEEGEISYREECVREEQRSLIRYAHFAPEGLRIEGKLDPEIRHRGIFRVPVYTASLHVTGSFARPDFSSIVPEGQVDWPGAFLAVGVSDGRGLREQVPLTWNGARTSFLSLTTQAAFPYEGNGIQAPVTISGSAKQHEFDFDLKLAGTENIRFFPAGRETEVRLASSWEHPNFQGSYLPVSREIGPTGFLSYWKVLHLGTDLVGRWLDKDLSRDYFEGRSFGVNLIFPVDVYQASDRATKYAHLFIFLTFVAFFLFEILGRLRVHPVQYLLVGSALALFYLLLLSLSEYLPFGSAYAIATAGTVGLITAYLKTLLGKKSYVLGAGALLSGLYAYLYTLLRAEDRSLLLGSIGLFLILATVMYVTQKVDWQALGSWKNEDKVST